MTIGENTFIHPTAVICDTSDVIIGDNCYIGPYCVIGCPPQIYDINAKKTSGVGVIIGDNNVFHGNNIVESGINGLTSIGRYCTFMSGAHVGHDCFITENAIIGSKVILGGSSTLHSFCVIGENSVINEMSILSKGTTVKPMSFVDGQYSACWKTLSGAPAKELNAYNVENENSARKFLESMGFTPNF